METENTWNFFVIEPIAALSAFSFLPGAVNLAKPSYIKYFFLLSAMSRKSHRSNDTQFHWARLLSFDMARCSWQLEAQCVL